MTRKVLTHVTLWTAFFATQTLGYYTKLPEYNLTQWAEFCYNCLSLIGAFYAVSILAQRFCDKGVSYKAYKALHIKKKIAYWLNIYTALTVCVLLAYIAMSVFLDNEFFGHGYKEIGVQSQRRFVRVITYIITGAGWGFFLNYKRKADLLITASNERIRIYKKETAYIKELYQKMVS